MGANYESRQELQEASDLRMKRRWLFCFAYHMRLAFFSPFLFLKLYIAYQKVLCLEEAGCCFDFA